MVICLPHGGGHGGGSVLYYCVYSFKSATIIQVNEGGCRGAPCKKLGEQESPLSNTIKDTRAFMRNPLNTSVKMILLNEY